MPEKNPIHRGSNDDNGNSGVGNIGSAVARHLVAGGESVILTAKDTANAQAPAEELGPYQRAAAVQEAISSAGTVLLAVWLDSMRELIPAWLL